MKKRVRKLKAEDVSKLPVSAVLPYEEIVTLLIRERYTTNAELAILRQRDSKPIEFAEYNKFCEGCKARAKAMQDVGGVH